MFIKQQRSLCYFTKCCVFLYTVSTNIVQNGHRTSNSVDSKKQVPQRRKAHVVIDSSLYDYVDYFYVAQTDRYISLRQQFHLACQVTVAELYAYTICCLKIVENLAQYFDTVNNIHYIIFEYSE